MIDRKQLLSDLQTLLRKEIEPDLRKRSELPEIAAALKTEFDKAKKAKRTALNYTDWRADTITQIGVAWVLSCVFIRFLEDNRLVDPPRLSGPTAAGDSHSALQRARDEYQLHIDANPEHSFRQFILSVIDDLSKLSGGKEVFGKNNIIHQHRDWLSNDAAKLLYNFWQKIEPATGELIHSFTDDADEGEPFDTRFLGDLYQDLSEAARKKYALLQTPNFVEAFILDRTLEPALDEFGLEPRPPEGSGLATNTFRMIDPACGSGHFLLGAFDRILDRWQRREPGTKVDVLVERTLASIHGVDVNPFAVAIARFRLLLAAFRACHVTRLNQPIDFHINVACGDSLYHGVAKQQVMEFSDEHHYFQTENAEELCRILQEGTFHAVVANPPYITPKDKAANTAYRELYESCHRQYSLSVPFMERIFRLAVRGGLTQSRKDAKEGITASGYTGQITSNSFMKREFGKKLIESYFPKADLTHVIDTSGAYIPGHGTPTVILFGRNRTPIALTIRTVMGIRGEPSTPEEACNGRVWTSIVNQVDEAGWNNEFVSVADTERQRFTSHPWSIGGGGAAELKEELDQRHKSRLKKVSESIGFVCITKADEFFQQNALALSRKRIEDAFVRTFGIGEEVRDWGVIPGDSVIFPYSTEVETISLNNAPRLANECWRFKTELGNRKVFGGLSYFESGKPWYEFGQIPIERFRIRLSIPFAFVATHNHFVLDRGGKVFNRSAPVIKLPTEATEDDHLGLLGLLNSSTACFWMKQVFHDKGSTVDSAGARQATVAFENFREFTGTGLQKCPIPNDRPLELSRQLDSLAQQLYTTSPDSIITQRREVAKGNSSSPELCDLAPLREALTAAQSTTAETLGKMIRLQEDLDWQCYGLYGLVDEQFFYPEGITAISRGLSAATPPDTHATMQTDPEGVTATGAATPSGSNGSLADTNPGCAARPGANGSDPFGIETFGIDKGQRTFEIVLARKMAAGELETTWFERHGSTPITELPDQWPDYYKALVNRRIDVIESNPNIALIEQPEYKRRWNTEPWDSQVERALREWMLIRLESYFDFDGRMEEGVVSDQSSVVSKEETENGKLKTDHFPIAVYSVAKLADVAFKDAQFKEVAEVYRGRADFDPVKLIDELVADEHVPALPILRYKPAGIDKRAEWENTWRLQRIEDQIHARVEQTCRDALTEESAAAVTPDQPLDPYKAKLNVNKVDFTKLAEVVSSFEPTVLAAGVSARSEPAASAVGSMKKGFAESKLGTLVDLQRLVAHEILGDIPVPPKYKSSDFISTGGAKYWKLRGKLDVPKERWVSFPHCQGEDQTLAIAWAGYDHLQLLQAIAAYFAEVQQLGGSDDPRLVPLLAAMDQQIPWVKQWHNDTDNEYGYALGDYFEEFIATEARNLSLTMEDVRAWAPSKKVAKATKPKKASKAAADNEDLTP